MIAQLPKTRLSCCVPLLAPWLLGSACATGAALEEYRAETRRRASMLQGFPPERYDSEFHADSGPYLTIRGGTAGLGGDFDGGTVLVGPSDVIVFPDVEAGRDLGIGFGVVKDGIAGQISYTGSWLDGDFQGASVDVLRQAVSLDVILYSRANDDWQPYWLIGFSVPWVRLDDASTDGAQVGDARLRGLGVNLGSGLAWYSNRRFSLDLRGELGYDHYVDAKGVVGSEGIDDSLGAFRWGLSVGATWILSLNDLVRP